MLGGRDSITGRGINYHNTALSCFIHINVIDTNTSPGNHLQLVSRLNNLGINLGLASHHQAFVVADGSN